MLQSHNCSTSGTSSRARRWLAVLACISALTAAAPSMAAPSYMSYWGLGRNIPEVQDHINLYWAVTWIGNGNEILSQLADAKARGMRAMVHVDWLFFSSTSGGCPITLNSDSSTRWNSFVQDLSAQGLLDTVGAF